VIGFDGSLILHQNVTSGIPDDLEEILNTLALGQNQNIPGRFTLHQNYPNPFNPLTTIAYDLSQNTEMNITIYDLMGREVKTLLHREQTAGKRRIQWNATNNQNQPVSSGTYILLVKHGEVTESRKMILVK
tara:strand:- start:137 stop:529 length:393 start_codon:yes stop_codon:yes gene_type:complete